ncbi:MAG: tRNA (guanosine(46)-N7)-methyltransferase TrmB [Clostridiales bacterium]|jgi:tRNA (guanine-N7-)-methyltransferase|nr:tRNA (guanosine(46)-N7)-methyltransferase TrmB [Clostridiales bacterium]
MRLRHMREAGPVVAESPLIIKEQEALTGVWRLDLPQGLPLYLEIGMGRGKFIIDSARANPHINWLGIEKQDQVLYLALKRLTNQEIPANLRFFLLDALQLEQIFRHQEIERIYLNFSDPWPKKRHHKRRLTTQGLLNQYQKILTSSGQLFLKTDNPDFYAWSCEQLKENSWKLLEERTPAQDTITTEYEERFIRRGQTIYASSWQSGGQRKEERGQRG